MDQARPDAADAPPEPTRRDFLTLVTITTATVGTALSLWPFIDSMEPAADVLAEASINVDLAPIALGQRITVRWRGKPVFIVHRTPEQIERAKADDNAPALRDPQTDADRVIKPEWLILIGICTHLGCVPQGQTPGSSQGQWGGWFCPCHASQYDLSGRIRQGPAPRNLVVPPYTFLTATTVKIG